MKRKQLFAELTELEDQLLEQYFTMDQELARKHTRKRIGVRVLAVAACMAILLCACVPVGMLAHPAGRAVLKGDSEALTEQLNKIEGFQPWQEKTAEKLEQTLPGPMWELLQTTPIMDVLTQSQYPAYAMKNATFAPYASGEVEPEILVYFLDDESGHFGVETVIDAAPEQYVDDTAPETFVLEHEDASYELRYAYSQTQSLTHQAVHVYELHQDAYTYTAYVDVEAGECIYWSSPMRAAAAEQGGVPEAVMTQRAYDMLAECVRDPEAYEQLTYTEDGLYICEYTRNFLTTFVPCEDAEPIHPALRSCDRAIFAFDGAGNMVSFDLAYLGALRNAEKQVPEEIYTLAENYFRSTFRDQETVDYVADVHDTPYVVVITPNGGLALKHEFTLDLVFGSSASLGYIVPMAAGKAENDFEKVEISQPDGQRVLLSATTSEGSAYKYEYDQNGRLIREIRSASGVVNREIAYTYDELGQLIKKEEFDGQGNLEYLYLYEYDELGRVVFEQDGFYNCKRTYTYDANGNYVKLTEDLFDGSVSETKVEVTRDAAGNVIGEKYYENGALVSEHAYEYDAQNRLLKHVQQFADDGFTVTFEYKYEGIRTLEYEYRGGTLIYSAVSYYNRNGELTYGEYCQVGATAQDRWTVTYHYGYLGQ